jgi:predicted YcjX-like family ATPase
VDGTQSWSGHYRESQTMQCFTRTVADSFHNNFRKVIPEEQQESKQKVGNTMNLATTFTDYCDKCSLHGLKYIGDLQLHPVER